MCHCLCTHIGCCACVYMRVRVYVFLFLYRRACDREISLFEETWVCMFERVQCVFLHRYNHGCLWLSTCLLQAIFVCNVFTCLLERINWAGSHKAFQVEFFWKIRGFCDSSSVWLHIWIVEWSACKVFLQSWAPTAWSWTQLSIHAHLRFWCPYLTSWPTTWKAFAYAGFCKLTSVWFCEFVRLSVCLSALNRHKRSLTITEKKRKLGVMFLISTALKKIQP